MLAGGVVQSTIGFGLAVVAAPVVVLLAPDLMPAALLLPALTLPLLQLSRGPRDIAWRPLGWALGARTLFTPVGVAVVAWFSPRAIAALVGVLILVTVALSVRAIDLRATPRNAAVAGAVSGISGTAAAIGGPFLALVLQHERPERVRSTLAVFFVAGSLLGLSGPVPRGRADPRAAARGAGLGAVRPARLRRGGHRCGRGSTPSGSAARCWPSACWPASRSSSARRWPSLAGVPTPIDDPADPRLTDYVGLTDVALRRRTEPERGLYIAESEKVIRRALAAGHRPRSYLMGERWLTDLGRPRRAGGGRRHPGVRR